MNSQNILAVTNQKGGVGKSTTTVNLAAGLVRHGKRVLVVDADPQGNLTQMLGWQQPERLDVALSSFVEAFMIDRELPWNDGLLHNGEGIDLLPANIELSGTEIGLFQAMSREQALKSILMDCPKKYDYVLIDCSPSLGMLTINTLAAADRVIIPVQTGYLPAKGLELLLRTVNRVKRQINPQLQVEGILLKGPRWRGGSGLGGVLLGSMEGQADGGQLFAVYFAGDAEPASAGRDAAGDHRNDQPAAGPFRCDAVKLVPAVAGLYAEVGLWQYNGIGAALYLTAID